MWTLQGRMVGGYNTIRMVRKTLGRLHFMGNLRPFGLFQPCLLDLSKECILEFSDPGRWEECYKDQRKRFI